MKKLFSAVLAFFLAAAVPLVIMLPGVILRWEPDTSSGQYLLPSEAAIFLYMISVAIGAVVGMPAFFALRFGPRRFWWRLTLVGSAVGAAAVLFAWLGATGGNRVALLGFLPLGIASALVFGAVFELANGAVRGADARN